MTILLLQLALTCAGTFPPQDPDKPPQAQPDDTEERQRYLRNLSIEDLMNLDVFTPSRRDEPLRKTPSAITVIRQEDIRRSGARSIPEALRMVPGVHVAKIDGSTWAISIRGFNQQFSNKLQVLIDGRSVYTDLFSGVFWEMQDTMLEDVERIEVIRGPGASQWGANAVNGVINIITKKAADTQGGLVSGGAGTEARAFGSARYGGEAGEGLHYRVFAKYFAWDEQHEGDDDWAQGRVGTRFDWSPNEEDVLTLQGEYFAGRTYHERVSPILVAPFAVPFVDRQEISGGHLRGRWERTLREDSTLSLQLSYTRAERELDFLENVEDVVHLDFNHRFSPLEGHDAIWGLGYRLSRDEIDNTFTLSFTPDDETHQFISAFLQDEIQLVPDALSFLLGSTFEYNTHSGLEIQPTARLSWAPHERHAVWASASRAVRTPSRTDDDFRANFLVTPGPTVFAVVGDRDTEAEEVLAFELGYRVQPTDTVSFDLVGFTNRYDDLLTEVPGAAFFEPLPLPGHTVVPVIRDNGLDGKTYGVELATTWDVTERWRITGSYTLLRMFLNEEDDTLSTSDTDRVPKSNPRHQAYLRSSWDILDNFELDLMGRYVDVLDFQDVDSYVEAGARIGWHVTENLELSAVGQNLVHDEHFEFGNATDSSQATEAERGFYLMLTWRF